MIYVIATIEIVPGRRDDFLREFQANVPAVLAEDGCIEYVPTIDFETGIPAQGEMRPDVVTVVEKWADTEALEDHLIAPHMLTYRAKVKEMVQRVSLQVLEPA
ncbi:MAG TPA: putative quinol monooxygenase [Pirellulaceae bacterium]|nr:putative quinol monooxygenase [Pirellulaceae bacterium]